MRREDGKELLVTLGLPLPFALAGDLVVAIGTAAEYHGYTDVLLVDGMRQIVATPPDVKRDDT